MDWQTQIGSINNCILGGSESYLKSQVAGGSSLDTAPLQDRDQAAERPLPRCLEKSFCPFPVSCLTFPLPHFTPVFVVSLQACDGLSAVREGECFRRKKQEVSTQMKGAVVC